LTLAKERDRLLEPGALAGQRRELAAIRDHGRVDDETLELLVTSLYFLQALEHLRASDENGVEDRPPPRHPHRAAIAKATCGRHLRPTRACRPCRTSC